MYTPQRKTTAKPPIDMEVVGWPAGYMSTGEDGVVPQNALADMTNMDMSQNSLPFIRRSLTPYGKQFVGTCIGIGTFQKTIANGKQERWEISMQVVDETAALYTRKDGEEWTIVSGSYSYDSSAWVSFAQSNARVYIANGVDALSYYDIVADGVVVYTQLTKPATPTVTQTGLTGSSYTYFYVVTATSEAGETDTASEGSVGVSTLRESWDGSTQYIDVAFTLPSGSTGGNIYVGTSVDDMRFLATVPAGSTTYRDMGASVATITKTPPLTNSTGGPTLTYLINIIGQIFGWGDIDNPSYVWYDGGSSGSSGNFTVGGGGGYVGIDDGGPSVPVQVLSFRTGKGDPIPTVLCRGPAGTGGFRQISFTPETIGDLTALMPSVSEANGDVGSVSPMAGVTADDSIHFPTGLGFMYEGSAPNVPNILSANTTSDFIQPDVQKLNLAVMDKAIGLFYEGRIYWALPVISATNNQIWVLDLKSNPARWIMPWTISAQYMWLYEDNTGTTHFCLLVDGMQLEFSDVTFSNDNGVPFHTRCASGEIRWDKAGISMGYIQTERFKIINARGDIDMNVSGTDQNNSPIDPIPGNISVDQSVPETGWGESVWGEDDWGDDPDVTPTTASTSQTVPIAIKEKLSELTWEVVTGTAGCGYTLGATHTQGIVIPKLYAGD